uniref:Conserved hypothetical plastid protein n=1 Tax=Calliarthron tuberculosum TaxID=48942 RepID=M4IUX0_CALTB|nr:conserved hypothetical plastid protein [Calliarthron tuberculosum]AGA63789.1 conserved hypothetical plastid protein [Calliarthron tuberculosum]
MYKQILLVDDDICLAYAIQSYISSKDMQIFIVDDSNVAIQLLQLYSFDLIISDIMMPNMNGYEFLSNLRSNDDFLNIPFIFLTAKGMTNDRIKGYNLGCNAYLTKPFHPSELLSIINNLLNGSKSVYKNNSQKKKSDLLVQDINIFHLTDREISIMKLLVKGLMNKEIANSLNLSKRNVEKYVSRLLTKTNTRNRTELAQLPISALLRANDGTRTRE